MKRIILFLTILISTIFSNVAFADIMMPPSKFNIITDILYPLGFFLIILVNIFTIKGIISFLLSKITFFKNINKNFVKIYFSSSLVLIISLFITLTKTFGEFQRFDNYVPLVYGLGISIFLTFITEFLLFNKIRKLTYKKSLIFAFASNLLFLLLILGIL